MDIFTKEVCKFNFWVQQCHTVLLHKVEQFMCFCNAASKMSDLSIHFFMFWSRKSRCWRFAKLKSARNGFYEERWNPHCSVGVNDLVQLLGKLSFFAHQSRGLHSPMDVTESFLYYLAIKETLSLVFEEDFQRWFCCFILYYAFQMFH